MRHRLAIPLSPNSLKADTLPPDISRAASSDRHRDWFALVLLCVAQFVVALDVQIVAIALPAIGQDLGMARADLQWVVSAYVLSFGGFLLLAGRLADLFGRRRLFMLGFALFTLASLGCGLAASGTLLIVARATQGLGAALVAPAALSLLTTAFEEGPRRTYALGVWGAAAPLGGASGFLLGGLLTGGPGWPWVFLVNVPVGLLVLVLAPILFDESRTRAGTAGLDLGGALTSTSGLMVLVYALTRAESAGFGAPTTLTLLALAASLITAFCVIEGRVKNPLVPFAIFRRRNVAEANLIYLVLTAVNGPVLFLLTLYLQDTLGYTPLEAGLAFLPASLVLIAAAPLGAWLTSRGGYRLAMGSGTFTLGVAVLLFSRLTTNGSYATDLLPGLLLLGVGLNVASVAASVAGTSGLDAGEQGLASGLLNTSAQIGTALGLAAFVMLSAGRMNTLGLSGASPDEALVGGLRLALLAAATLAFVAAIVVTPFAFRSGPRRRR